jgi:hypothetical protein
MRTGEHADSFVETASNAEREATAQLEIISALKALGDRDRARRVLLAVQYLCEAEKLVPGIFAKLASNQSPPKEKM